MDPDRMARAMGDGTAGVGCVDCDVLGHICRPCRKARYEARHEPVQSHRGQALFWWAYLALLVAGVVVVAS